MTTYLGEKAVGIGTVKAEIGVTGNVLHDETLVGNGNTEPLGVNTANIVSQQTLANTVSVLNTAIDGQAEAIVKTRNDFEVADQEIRADMNAEDSRLQTQITSQAAAITGLKSDKLDRNLDPLNAGKYLIVGDDGNVELTTSGGGGGIANVIHDSTLSGKGTDNNPLGVNTEVIATKEDLESKQDKLTAGTNIKIEDNVISSTAQESFFRGRYATWTSVPTIGDDYTADFRGDKTPSYNDYIVVEDASLYIPQDFASDPRNVMIRNLHTAGVNHTIEISIQGVVRRMVWVEATDWTPLTDWLSIKYVKGGWQIKTAKDFYLNNEFMAEVDGAWLLRNETPSEEQFYLSETPGVAPVPIYGSWRFVYHGNWAEDNKNGWVAEYQIEETLPIATETQAGINRTYTAGANIHIEDNVISSTAQESFFRGSFSDWADVPTDISLYTEDYRGNTAPTTADYIVVKNTSGYVKPGKDIIITQLKKIGGEARIKITIGTTDWVLGHNTVTQNPAVVGGPGEQLEVSYTTPSWSIKSLDIPVIVDGVEYEPGVVAYKFSYNNTSTEYVEKTLNYASVGSYEGTWRFSYIAQSWEESNKNGWYPEYQIEETLPIATETQAGINRLYTAGANITIVDNVISSNVQESFFRGRFTDWADVPTIAQMYNLDFNNNRKPTNNDYIVVEDASGFTPGLDIELAISQTGTREFVIEGIKNYAPAAPDSVSWELDDITITASFAVGGDGLRTYFTANKTVLCDGVVYAPGEYFAKIVYYGDPGRNIYYSNNESLSGSWRFVYRGVWDTDLTSGWKAEYQIEEVMPTANETQAGIAKLYTTSGTNTDGSMTQKAVGDAISAHNTATNAHSNIRGVAGGLATLDNNAKVPMSQINDALLGNVEYMGLWNAAENVPFLADPSGDLPFGYTQLQAIQGSGGAYIDTGVVFTGQKIKYTMDWTAGSGSYERLYGACTTLEYYASQDSTGSIFFGGQPGDVRVSVGEIQVIPNITTSGKMSTELIVDSQAKSYEFIINDNRYTGTFTGDINREMPIHLCRQNYQTSNAPAIKAFVGKVYSFSIEMDGVVVRNMLPARRDSDGVVGMYDTINDVFYGPADVGVFIAVEGDIQLPKGDYYITSVAGDRFGLHFDVGDWVISTGEGWTKVDNTDAVSAVNGMTGNVVLHASDVDAYTKTEVDNKILVINESIDAQADAIAKTRDDMDTADSELQTQITAQASAIAGKQDKLTAGENITIEDGVISATGGGASLPDQTDNAGKFLTTDGTTASWSDKPLVNNNYSQKTSIIIVPEKKSNNASAAVAIGVGAAASSYSVHVGYNSYDILNGGHSVGIGYGTQTKNYSIAIGNWVKAQANYAIQIGCNAENYDSNTFKVANQNGNFEMMSADGTIPAERIGDLDFGTME